MCAWVTNIIAYYDLAAPTQPKPPARVAALKPNATSTYGIEKADIVELKALGKPPTEVIEVISAASLLLGFTSDETPNWQAGISDVNFLGRLLAFKAEEASPSAIAQAKAIAEEPFFSYEEMARKSRPAARLANWVLSVLELPQKPAVGVEIFASDTSDGYPPQHVYSHERAWR